MKMAKLRAYPQTEREAQQIHTIAFVVLLTGERKIREDGVETASLFISREHTNAFLGKEVALFLEEGEDGDTLVVHVFEPEDPIVDEESTDGKA
jgi:hypothetical protein